MMKMAVAGGKGGTGKSMVAVNLAVEYARSEKTMLVDADAECPDDHLLLSVEREEKRPITLMIPVWDFDLCTKCGLCAGACKQDAIVFVKDRFPAFVQEECNGCGACILSCPTGAITEGRKEIGKIYEGENHGVRLVTGELKLGEMSSGEVVVALKRYAEEKAGREGFDMMIIDSAAGIGCPVISSITGSDYVVAVTEPTPSALYDLKRAIFLAEHFQIPHGIVLNKYDLDETFAREIERYAGEKGIPILGRIPYRQDFVDATIKMVPLVERQPEYRTVFRGIMESIGKHL